MVTEPNSSAVMVIKWQIKLSFKQIESTDPSLETRRKIVFKYLA